MRYEAKVLRRSAFFLPFVSQLVWKTSNTSRSCFEHPPSLLSLGSLSKHRCHVLARSGTLWIRNPSFGPGSFALAMKSQSNGLSKPTRNLSELLLILRTTAPSPVFCLNLLLIATPHRMRSTRRGTSRMTAFGVSEGKVGGRAADCDGVWTLAKGPSKTWSKLAKAFLSWSVWKRVSSTTG